MRSKELVSAVWKTVRSKWYWMAALLAISVLLFLLLGIKLAIGVFALGIVAIISLRPESFFAAGIIASVIMGVFLTARVEWLAMDAAKIAFAFMAVGTLLGGWRLWTTPETGEGSPGDEGE